MHAQNVLYLFLLFLSLLLSAFFAGSETALVSLGRIDLARLRESGDPRAAIIRNPDHGVASPHPRKQQNRREQPRHQLH